MVFHREISASWISGGKFVVPFEFGTQSDQVVSLKKCAAMPVSLSPCFVTITGFILSCVRKQRSLFGSGCSWFEIEVYYLYPNMFTIWQLPMLSQEWIKDVGLIPVAVICITEVALQLSTSVGTARIDCCLFLSQISSLQELNPMFAKVDFKFPLFPEDVVSNCRMILTAKNWGSVLFLLFTWPHKPCC